MSKLPHIPVVDHLRGLAALAVAWFHLTNTYQNWIEATGRFGWLGVEAFFVISGFIIPYSIKATFPNYQLSDYPNFILRRLVRLEPPYIVSIVLILALTALAARLPQFAGTTEGVFDVVRIASHFFYVIPLTDYDWLQPVYWTLAFEFAFYLTIGLLFPFISGTTQRKLFLAVCAAFAFAIFLGFSPQAALFVIGVATFRLVVGADVRPVYYCVVIAAVLVMFFQGLYAEASVGLGVSLIIAYYQRLPALPSAMNYGLGRLGLVSYSFYLVHVPIGGRIVNIGKRFVDGPLSSLVLSLGALLVSVIFAIAFWYLFERTAQMWARRLKKRRGPSVSGLASSS